MTLAQTHTLNYPNNKEHVMASWDAANWEILWSSQSLYEVLPRGPSAAAGTKKAVKIGNGYDPIKVGAKFEVERDLLGMKLPMRQVVDCSSCRASCR